MPINMNKTKIFPKQNWMKTRTKLKLNPHQTNLRLTQKTKRDQTWLKIYIYAISIHIQDIPRMEIVISVNMLKKKELKVQ